MAIPPPLGWAHEGVPPSAAHAAVSPQTHSPAALQLLAIPKSVQVPASH